MKRIIRQIGQIFDSVANVIFLRETSEAKMSTIISSIARLHVDRGDRHIRYPCGAYSFFAYRNKNVRAMIWQLKYKGHKDIVKIFATKMYEELCEELAELKDWSNFGDPILLPIPISKSKKKIRGFNQTDLICQALSDIDQNRFFHYLPDVLYKIKDTMSQANVKDRLTRLENLKDSFAINIKDIELIKDQNIILLDDVLTTGSTLTEATKTLKKAGVKNIIWLVVAH